MESQQHEHVIVVGAGPIGLSCAISAQRRGLNPLVIDAGAVCNSIVNYPLGMTFFTTPERLEIGGHPLVASGQKATREEALKYYRGVARVERLRIQTYTRLTSANRTSDHIRCELATETGTRGVSCERLVIATGYFDHPNRLHVPGEDLPHVSHYFREAHSDFGRDVVVIGGKNSAIEAALTLFRAGARVTLIYRGTSFSRSVKYWLKPDIENRIRAGEIKALLGSTVAEITKSSVFVRSPESKSEIPAQRVYALIGFQPDFELFESMGIELDDDGVPTVDPDTMETNVPGIHMCGSLIRGKHISDIFIENSRFDGEKVFGDASDRARAEELYRTANRYYGE